MEIAVLIFDGITALDAVGPYEVLQRLPGAEVKFVAHQTGPQRTDTGSLALMADYALADVMAPGILVVPGGFGTRPLMTDEPLLEWIRAVHERTTWTTSVCTGSLLLAAAGLLNGLDATTHWAQLDVLPQYGARPTLQRVVEQGKIITAAGVSSGIDMALTLAHRIAGETFAQSIQLAIEYDPQPPFDSGSPAKASPEVVELLRGRMVERMGSGR
jgi:putative intracellular protease/amidase